MLRKLIYPLAAILLSACCQSTKTYESFTDEESVMLVYPDEGELLFISNFGDSSFVSIREKFIGNKHSSTANDPMACDFYYPAYGKVSLSSQQDTADLFQLVLIKDIAQTPNTNLYIKWMDVSYSIFDTTHSRFYDSLLLKNADPFQDVYKITADTAGRDSSFIHTLYFNKEYGIIRYDKMNGKIFRLKN